MQSLVVCIFKKNKNKKQKNISRENSLNIQKYTKKETGEASLST